MATKQMLDQFYSLSGKTVAEKLRYLNHLISDVKSGCSQHEIDEFIAEIRPKNAFEKLLKGRLIDSFQRSHELIDVLKSDDKLFIKQVLGCDWFFEGYITGFPSCEYFMTEVFPNTSYSTRNSIIHMLSVHLKDFSLAEQLFEAVKSQYGIKQAKCLLCKCSENFIESVLDNDSDEVHFTQKEVIKLCKLHPNFVKHNIDKKYFTDHASNILQVMLDVDVKIFVEMFENVGTANVTLKIGRRASKKIIRSHPEIVIKLAAQYLRILERRHLFKYLTVEEFKLFYIELFPESFENSYFFEDNGDFYNVVDVFPPSDRLEMLLGCFEMVYGKSLLTVTNLVGEKLLKLLPSEQREQCAQQKIEKYLKENRDETYWMCYLTIHKSIPKLKTCLLKASNVDERSKFISFLILTCEVNEDLEALDSVCKHIVSRHRNDNFSLRAKFLSDLRDEFDLLKLEDKHWSSVMEMIKLFFLNEEYQRNTDLVSAILVKSIHYNLNRSADISEQIDKLIVINSSLCFPMDNWLILEKYPKYQQVIFQAFGERIPYIKKMNAPLTEVAMSFLKSVVTWNKEQTLFRFSVSTFSWVVESLRKIIKTDLDMQKEILLDLFTYDLETHVLFSDCVFESITEKDYVYFLQIDTEHLIQNAEEIVQFLLANNIVNYKRVFRTWNLLSFTQIKETVVNICRKTIENDSDTQKQANAIFLLSFLMEADNFSCLIAPFHPVTEKISLEADETLKMLPVSKTSAMCLKNINPWHDYSTITQFCKGDYLKYVLGSLISVCYNTSENKVVPFLERLTNSPVSLKKHAMRLSFNIVRKPQILPLLSKLWNGDRNPATREILFRLVFLALLTQRKRDMFDLFKYCLGSLTVDDKNLFYELSYCNPIPDDYKVEYVQLGWYKLHDLLEQGANTKPMISQLASVFQYMVDSLPSGFCEHVLKQYLIKDSPLWYVCVTLAAAYILHSKTQDVLETRFDLIFNLLKDLDDCASTWNNTKQFFSNVRDEAVSSYHKSLRPQIVFQLLQKCVSIWLSFLSPIYYFEDFVLMKFTILYYSCAPKFDLPEFGRLSSGYVLSLIEEYGQETIMLVGKTFIHLLNEIKYLSEYSEWIKIPLHVITGVLMAPTCKYKYIMAAQLIPDDFPSYEDVKDTYIHIMRSLLRTEDRTVSLIICSLSVFKDNFALLDIVENRQVT